VAEYHNRMLVVLDNTELGVGMRNHTQQAAQALRFRYIDAKFGQEATIAYRLNWCVSEPAW
jgi:hypothetical protein